MNTSYGINTILTDEGDEYTWRVALSDDSVGGRMHTSPSDDALINARDNANAIIQIAKSDLKVLVSHEIDRVYAERS